MSRWTFRYPRNAVSPSPWWARARTALHLLRPQWSRRVGDLPAPLRAVHWPPSVTPLGVWRVAGGARHVRLRVPTAPEAAFRSLEAVRDALRAAGLSGVAGGAVGFDVRDDLFDLGTAWLGTGTPLGGVLNLPLLHPGGPADQPGPGLSLDGRPGRTSGGAPHLFLPADIALGAVLDRWQAGAAAQGWEVRPPLHGDGQVLLTFTQVQSTVTLTGVRLHGGAWGFTLERDTWAHLHRLSSAHTP
ncbi:hypothetical protein [Deinococcus soli (ex Cha et al. 2016)]|uniref:Uncharacterized protein n=2 Tax=Deinococcus soli (ex Cha et al. 2016) TaxID=1309411 RepID=A0ACC6KDD0_9DEIO|nr:hypothetical protein [Deinococcus soli (ex Cha et al. 2016)]MDR6217485.1 hypothetical protein [Deinococcus soli (ex Cha et al. 2016)]MDR6326794.1 hypothetical protein [Deinococcus soli (ex Cha et al. 2016)]MDR6750479.1 hypothetical protein [Deinococcus soli (ex Cha et al. 2016)]